MGKTLSAEQVKSEMLRAMPGELGELYHRLWNEVALLHHKWNDFLGLFASGAQMIELLKHTAPRFFYQLQSTLRESVFLHLCRLTDPVKSCNKPNLTLMRLRPVVPDADLHTRLQPLVDDVVETTKYARVWRNRRLAHLELPAPHGQVPKPLPPATRQCVDTALTAIRNVMNCVELHYQHSTTYYEGGVAGSGGIESLLFYLKKGRDAQQGEDEAYRQRYSQSY